MPKSKTNLPPRKAGQPYSFAELCDHLRISDSTMRRMIKANKAPAYYMAGKDYRFDQIDVERWKDQQKQTSGH